MKVQKKLKTIEVEFYVTKDGQEFEDKSKAQLHEDILDGNKKVCQKCNGRGRINERWVKEWQNMSMCPADNKEVDVLKTDECDVCHGKGHLEKKWI